jgi:hypothetical protein
MGAILRSPEVALHLLVKAEEVTRLAEADEAIQRNEMPIAHMAIEAPDRVFESVAIAHPGGRNVEVKHGVLVKAAAEAGLEVNPKGERLLYAEKVANLNAEKAKGAAERRAARAKGAA